MMAFLLHPAVRLSAGLVALTISVLFIGELLGIVPDKSQVTIDARKKLSETLAIQFAFAAEQEDFIQIETTLMLLVKRNPEVLSAAMRKNDGSFYVVAGNHQAVWQEPLNSASPSLYIKVPIMQGNQLWGTVELSYASSLESGFLNGIKNSFWGMLLFVAIVGFLSYLIFLKRALKELDPAAVIPERVKAAFDSLTEGVLILDEQEQIVLANRVFVRHAGLDLNHLIGKKASSLKWKTASVEQLQDGWLYPWLETLKSGAIQTGVRLSFNFDSEKKKTFIVNCSPILGSDNQCKGSLATFDDVTQLEDKNLILQSTVEELELSKNEIFRQNDQLKILAEIDPLTGCLNRRAFHTYFDEVFANTCDRDTNLVCIMLDIDHFKSINDNFGHQTGDKVIKLISDILRENLRDADVVGRYGGEEFCLVLPDLDTVAALSIAERIRVSIMDASECRLTGIGQITASLGFSTIKDGVKNPHEMIGLADKALYYAKNNGRNRVAVWSDTAGEDADINNTDKASDNSDVARMSSESDVLVTDVGQLHKKIKELENLNEEQRKTFNRRLNFDPITGLPGRVLLHDYLKNAIHHAQRFGGSIAVLSLTFSPYNRIHGTLGYEAAEKLIIKLSSKLRDLLRATDIISSDCGTELFETVLSRKNDDGFYILIPYLEKEQAITRIISRIRNLFSQPVVVEEFKIQVDSAIGISLCPTDGQEPDSLLKYADLARHYAEAQGKNNCQFYSDTMNNLYATQLKIESELTRAIERNELEVYYQPVVDAQHGRISKIEALLRWNHPEKGVLSAINFIEVAEESGLIKNIGDWVLREVIQQLAVWRRELSQEVFISVNISEIQLRQDDLTEKIIDCLRENEVPPRNLILEITESIIMQDMEHATKIMEQLHGLGIQIALDDFGTGYSSLQYLQKFPIDIVKIDRSFVADIESNDCDAIIVAAIIDLAKKLGLTTVAEGVETEAQFKLLRQMKCVEIQGYLISRPVTKAHVCKMLERQESSAHKSKVWFAG